MIYSVYNWTKGRFDYYKDSLPMPVAESPKSRTIRQEKLGASPDGASESLPADAKLVGDGESAQGVIATSGISEGEPTLLKIGLLGLSAYLLWKYVKK